jgi:tetratricopeptide (TPR) repeat protein
MEKHFTLIERIQFLIGKASRKTKPTQRANALKVLCEALEQIALIPESWQQSSYLNDVARVCVELGLTEKCIEVLNQALEVAQTIPYENLKAHELSKIGGCYVEAGLTGQGLELLDQALQIAKTLEDVDERDLTLCEIASEYGEIGQVDLAIEIAGLVEDKYRADSRVFGHLAARFVILERHDQVQQFIEAAYDKPSAILDAMGAYERTGDYERMLQFIDEVEPPVNKVSALASLAKAYLKADQKDKALETLDHASTIAATLQDRNYRSFAKETIASVRAQIEK